MPSVLFVCLGNICRSPTAHGVFEHLVDSVGLAGKIQIDSAGVSGWHVGEAPDKRSQQHAARRGYCLSHLRARQVVPEDFASFDLLLAMDNNNLRHLLDASPAEHRHKIKLFLDFAEGVSVREVPDPYYGEGDGFERVLDLVENACQGLLTYLKRQYGL